ncbi:MmgE/PrpD family protein [Paenarthrobacter sp. RAF54_2]|uniref:MmgE/PrpD family protein n=1 Tax=Paenarthrobacter sp. RAF54_2 TaxID=3233061 RepID=UPI003F95F1C4
MVRTDETSADGFTARVAEEVAAMSYADLPPLVITRARHVLLDWLGAAMAGSVEPVGRIAQGIAAETGSRPVATIIGTQLRTSPREAAMANAMAAHALDFDDSSFWMDGHPSAAVVSAAVALGEALRSTTGQAVAAIVAGLQGQARIALATGPSAYENGFHGTGIYGTFGAAGACAHLLGLDVNGFERSYTLAATQAAGLRRTFGTMSKHLNAANAASGGMLAAQLAAKGFTAPTDGIEGRQGFVWTHSTTFDPSRPQAVMGDRLAIESVLFKRHASCHGTHSTINGVAQLRAAHAFTENDIAGVRLFVPDKVTDICCISDPVSGLEGKFSVRHAASIALAGLDTGPAGFTDASVHDARLVALRQLVTVCPEVDRQLTAPTRVEITLHNGHVLEAEVDAYQPTQDSELGAEWEALKSKFISLASPVIGTSAARDVVGGIERLDPDRTIGQLLNLE